MGVFSERVTRRFPLDRPEIAFLEALEAHPVPVRRGEVIVREGDPASHAFVLMSGWAMSYTRFRDGSHQVRRLHFPGDLLAMPSVPMRHYSEDLEALSDALVAPFPKRLLGHLFEMPRLAAIMYMFAQAERVTAGDRMASLGRSRAKARVAFLIADVLQRLRSADPSVGSTFPMHLTREQIANVAGMTPVHASRMWSALIADGLIRCSGRTVTVVDEKRLMELSQYHERDSDFDRNWLAEVEAGPGPAGAGA